MPGVAGPAARGPSPVRLAFLASRIGLLVVVLAAVITTPVPRPAAGGEPPGVALGDPEVRLVLRHGPWPAHAGPDPSNRASGESVAIALGQRLFFDARLSSGNVLACATCHVLALGWTDGRRQAMGRVPLDRNTPSVLNVGLQRWFGWDGGADSLWSQSLRPIVDPRELGATAEHVASLVHGDPTLACLYRRAFDEPARPHDGPARRGHLVQGGMATTGPGSQGETPASERVLVNAGKALAAFLETVRSGRTPFDEFRDALARGDGEAAARYPAAALRGLRLFVGRGNCRLCHVGPAFTNGEFHDVGVPYMARPGRVDPGRYGGLQRVRADRFNLLGPYSDDPTRASALKTRTVAFQHVTFGQFKTPSLRNVALTGPYMHDGRLATLRDVVRHYSDLPMDRLHTHGEIDDLVAFLESLTDPAAAALSSPSPVPGCPS